MIHGSVSQYSQLYTVGGGTEGEDAHGAWQYTTDGGGGAGHGHGHGTIIGHGIGH